MAKAIPGSLHCRSHVVERAVVADHHMGVFDAVVSRELRGEACPYLVSG
jgi:hypothetical protein